MKSTSLAVLLWAGSGLAQMPAGYTPEATFQVQTVSAVIPAPDGKMVAWVQSRAVMEADRSEHVPQIYVGAADGSRRFQLTRGDKGAANPTFSPDGHWVFFTSDRAGKSNIYRIAVAGGEAEMLTDFKGSMGNYQQSPDGKWIAFTGHEAPPDDEKAKKEKRDFRVVDADPPSHSLYLIPVDTDSDGKRAQKKVFDAKYHVTNFDWSPDSKAIAFEHWPLPGADYWTKADIAEVEIENGKVTDLAKSGAAESQPVYSPDGRFVAFLRTSDPPHWPGDARIVLLTRKTGEARALPPTYDEQPNLVGWASDSANILYSEAKRTRSALYEMPVDGPPKLLFEPAKGVIGNPVVNLTGTYVGLAREAADEKPEAYVMSVSNGAPVRVSRANVDLPNTPIGKTEAIRWKSKDGREVEGLLTYPFDYQPGQKYPFILNIHGGPAGQFSETFIGKPGVYPIATFASRGYAVLRPNPRGSSGYGKEFRYANVNDWGGKDYEDDQAGVDKVIEMGVADPDRMAIMGWSYGGYMTSWTITQTHRFKAAVIGAGVTDLWSFSGTADIPGFLPDYFGGEPWDQFENFQKHSPITYVKNVTTPTLLLHGEADERVPISQGFEYYHALKQQGVTTKMVTYPRTPHGPREPKFQLDIMNRHLDWVDKYVR